MKFSLLLLLCLFPAVLADAKSDFVQKLRKIAIIFWNETNLGKIADAIIEDVRTGKTMVEIADKGLSYVTPNTPALDYPKLLNLMTNMDKCLEGTGTKTMDVVKLVTPVFQNQLKGPYQTIKQKMVKMQGNKKTKAEQVTQAYTLAFSSFNKPLIQTIINNCSKKMNAQQWKCSVQNLPTIVNLSLYDTKKKN